MKYKYEVIVGKLHPWSHPFNVQRLHYVDGKFYHSGHGKGCKFLEQAMEWIVKDKAENLKREDTADVCVVKFH